MSFFLLRIIHAPIGCLYMRIRYGRYHKRQLILKYARSYGYAGMTAVWVPILAIFCIVALWALIHVTIFLAG